MSGYILCQTQKAKIPYYIENISTNVYSLEELCYYFYHNLYLVDETILNEHLCRWLQEELNFRNWRRSSVPCLQEITVSRNFCILCSRRLIISLMKK
ncbi:MAG: hypothetical protein V8Q73_03890 [Blautia sp.]